METIDIVNEIISCKDEIDGPTYFLNNYITIQDSARSSFVLEARDYQNSMVEAMHLNRRSLLPVARQIGTSTIICAYALWCAIFNDYQNIVVMDISSIMAQENKRGKFDLMYEGLPDWMKQHAKITRNNRDSVEFSNGSRIFFALPSVYSLRGMTINKLFLNGFDYYKEDVQHDILSSITPVMAVSHTSSMCICSCVCDGEGIFANMYRDAVDNIDSERSQWSPHLFNAATTNIFSYTDERDEEMYRKALGDEIYSHEYECGKLGAEYVNG